MPFETRFFLPSSKKWTQADVRKARRDVYLLGSDQGWNAVGLKLRDVRTLEPLSSSSVSELSSKLELKKRGENLSGVERWEKVVRMQGKYTLDEAFKTVMQARSKLPPQDDLRNFLLEQSQCQLVWIAVEKIVSKTSIGFGQQEKADIRITSLHANDADNKISTWTTHSMESYRNEVCAQFLAEQRKSHINLCPASYPEFLRTFVTSSNL
jgi:hypothetical protein